MGGITGGRGRRGGKEAQGVMVKGGSLTLNVDGNQWPNDVMSLCLFMKFITFRTPGRTRRSGTEASADRLEQLGPSSSSPKWPFKELIDCSSNDLPLTGLPGNAEPLSTFRDATQSALIHRLLMVSP